MASLLLLPTFLQPVSGKAMIELYLFDLKAENPGNHQAWLSLVLGSRRFTLQMPVVIFFARLVTFCLEHGTLTLWLVFYSGNISFISCLLLLFH